MILTDLALENTALHLAAHQNDEDLVRLLLNNDASVIVQNSKRMVPNGFTTNMNIIKLLNHKASEYESRAIRQRNKLPHEIVIFRPKDFPLFLFFANFWDL